MPESDSPASTLWVRRAAAARPPPPVVARPAAAGMRSTVPERSRSGSTSGLAALSAEEETPYRLAIPSQVSPQTTSCVRAAPRAGVFVERVAAAAGGFVAGGSAAGGLAAGAVAAVAPGRAAPVRPA